MVLIVALLNPKCLKHSEKISLLTMNIAQADVLDNIFTQLTTYRVCSKISCLQIYFCIWCSTAHTATVWQVQYLCPCQSNGKWASRCSCTPEHWIELWPKDDPHNIRKHSFYRLYDLWVCWLYMKLRWLLFFFLPDFHSNKNLYPNYSIF